MLWTVPSYHGYLSHHSPLPTYDIIVADVTVAACVLFDCQNALMLAVISVYFIHRD